MSEKENKEANEADEEVTNENLPKEEGAKTDGEESASKEEISEEEVKRKTSEKDDAKVKKEDQPKDKEASDESGGDKAQGEKSEKSEETAEDLLKSDLDGVKIRKAKKSKNVTTGICHVLATFNNTKVTFSDQKGNVISWSSSGKCNFRGSRKSTAYAAQVVTQDAGRAAMSHGMKEVIVKVKGPGMGRDSAVRTLQSLGFIVTSIIDVTPVPHNGCRPPKRRRV